jgi:hypothetical protein
LLVRAAMNKTKKLSIDRNTLRALDSAALLAAGGGAPGTGSDGLRCTLGCTQRCTQAVPCLGSRNC